MSRITCIALFLIASLSMSPAYADALTSQAAGNFVAAIPDMESLSDKMRSEGKENVLEAAVRPQPGDTDFRPYTKGAAVLKAQFPSDYAQLGQIASKHDFMSVENWADTGDKVMMAYVASKMDGKNYEGLKTMANVPPEVKAKLPPQVRAQVDQALVVLQVAAQVPPADKETVKPYLPQIDDWLNREQKKLNLTTAAPATAAAASAAAARP